MGKGPEPSFHKETQIQKLVECLTLTIIKYMQNFFNYKLLPLLLESVNKVLISYTI